MSFLNLAEAMQTSLQHKADLVRKNGILELADWEAPLPLLELNARGPYTVTATSCTSFFLVFLFQDLSCVFLQILNGIVVIILVSLDLQTECPTVSSSSATHRQGIANMQLHCTH